MNSIGASLIAVFSLCLFESGVAHAQAARTWVSGVGDDADPCTRTAPCKTFAGAISKTAAGGEISALDPAGFGAVTITKAVTINGSGTLTGILLSSGSGIRVQAGANDLVVLRNLSIVSTSTGLNGVTYASGGALLIEKCSISGKHTGSGVDVSLTSRGALTIADTEIAGGANGVRLNSTARLDAELRSVKITGSGNGVNVLAGSISIHDSLIADNTGAGILAQAGKVVIEGTRIDGNTTAVQVLGGLARLANSSFYNNPNGLVCTGGPITSAYDNRKGGNSLGNLTVCAEPLPPITIL